MKIQKVIDLCKKSGALYITEAEDTQWVGNGQALYPLYGVPEFTPETLCEVFGVSEEQQGKMILNEKTAQEASVDFAALSGDEDPVEILKIGFSFGGYQLIAIKSKDGISFIKRMYLAPFDEEIQLWRRVGKTGEYFIAAGGMFIKGIILPESSIRADIAAEIKDIASVL